MVMDIDYSIVRQPRTETSALYLTEPFWYWHPDDVVHAANALSKMHVETRFAVDHFLNTYFSMTREIVDLTFRAYNDMMLGWFGPRKLHSPAQKRTTEELEQARIAEWQSLSPEEQNLRRLKLDEITKRLSSSATKKELAERKGTTHELVDEVVENMSQNEARLALRLEVARRWRSRAYKIWNECKEDHERAPYDSCTEQRLVRASRVYCITDQRYRMQATDMAFLIAKTSPANSKAAAEALVNLVNPFMTVARGKGLPRLYPNRLMDSVP